MTSSLPTLAAYEARAREVLAELKLEVLFSEPGHRMWRTNRANCEAYGMWRFRPRVLAGCAARDLRITVLGQAADFPVLVAPSSSHQRVCREGELATVRAAGRAGTIAVLSTGANFSIEETAAVAAGPLWFQLYLLKDRGWTLDLVRRAEAAGFGAIVLTVDNVAGRLSSAQRKSLYKNWDVEGSYPLLEKGRALRNFAHLPEEARPRSLIDNVDPAVTWRDLAWLAGNTSLPIVVKGVQCAEDARLCVEHGARAVAVSNHGGAAPEMEGVRATLDILPEVVEEIGSEVEVYHDGGIRNGGDVLKALALGARAVMTGRPIQWGLAVAGEDGAFDVLHILRRELDSIMGICGLGDVEAITPKVLAPAPFFPRP